LTGAGKFNYHGTKTWLDDQFESGDSSILTDVSYVMCLDSISTGSDIYVHVSKPPKNGTAADNFLKNLELSGQLSSPVVPVHMVHKKINLAEEYLAWEHERFSIRRLPAFTVSHHDSHKDRRRASILDTRQAVSSKILSRNIRVIAETLGRHIYNLSDDNVLDVFNNSFKVDEGLVGAWTDYLSSWPRSAQLMTKSSDVVVSLEQAMSRYLKDVRKHLFKPDKRDPEVVFYSGTEYTMNAYSVKPAVFDLILAVAIASYLAVIYFVVQNFSSIYSIVKRITTDNNVSKKVH
jgi:hypothetical protein